ncbi:response regulator [Aestuariibacter sp. AA17]|uniref:Response regulator n=1 Tax=Fluctibacter corallii TaxID=2984329 RepID=A0ABT3AC08_9ALTE|nr:response regulator [Aestuariibacter sp. AA17]MCV2886211.1 response regulator [Aestuariibacter sp. AA17]
MLEIPSPKPVEQLRVLVIDGQTLVHNAIKHALEPMGMTYVKSAENAYYALRLCETHSFDVFIVSFDVKSDKDGFNLLEEMKFKGYVHKTSTVIFLSADTTQELVNCVIELEPSDFWVKPLDRVRIQQRMKHILTIKQELFKVQYCMDAGEYSTAIYHAERQLQDATLEHYHPRINRMVGDALMLLYEYKEAEVFYRRLAQRYKYAWVQIGLIRSLLKQNKYEEATPLSKILLRRNDTRFATYDALAEYYIDKEEYKKGYDVIKKATELAPRNLERNKKSWNLARLNHDREGQLAATKSMAKYAKNSIHDTPEFSLNVVRATLDFATTVGEMEANRMLVTAERHIRELRDNTAMSGELRQQLDIVEARVANLRKDKRKAEGLLSDHMSTEPLVSVEDSLDKMKAFHEIGYREEAIKLLEKTQSQVESDSFIGHVMREYLSQEKEERKNIHFTSIELAEMAAGHYKQRRLSPAFDLLNQALTLTPDNHNFAISLLKIIAHISAEERLNDAHQTSANFCLDALKEAELDRTQKAKVDEYCNAIERAL